MAQRLQAYLYFIATEQKIFLNSKLINNLKRALNHLYIYVINILFPLISIKFSFKFHFFLCIHMMKSNFLLILHILENFLVSRITTTTIKTRKRIIK